LSKRGTVVLYVSLGFFFVAGTCFLTSWAVGGWNALLPAIAGIVFALVAIVLGIIGLVLKTVAMTNSPVTPDAEPKPKATPEARKRGILIGISIPVGLAILGYFTFLTPIDRIQHNKDTLNSWKASLPDGVEMNMGEVGLIQPCLHLGSAENCGSTVFASLYFSNNPTPAEYCSEILAWAKSRGPVMFGDGSRQMDAEKYPEYAQLACASGNAVELFGQDGETTWLLHLFPYDKVAELYYDSNRQDYPDMYQVITPETRVTDDPSFFVLEAIGKWRKDHPGEKETNQSLESAVHSLTKYKEFQKAKVVVGRVDKLHYMTFPSPFDSTQTYCIVVEPYDQKFFGIPDPGYGYYPRWYVNDQASFGQFGDSSTDTCLNQEKQD